MALPRESYPGGYFVIVVLFLGLNRQGLTSLYTTTSFAEVINCAPPSFPSAETIWRRRRGLVRAAGGKLSGAGRMPGLLVWYGSGAKEFQAEQSLPSGE